MISLSFRQNVKFPILLFSFLLLHAYGEPPREIPLDLRKQFTMNGKVSVSDWYIDNSAPPSGDESSYHFSKKLIDYWIEAIKRKEPGYYGQTDLWLYEALEKYPLHDKDVGIIGSEQPWYESMVIAYGGRPTTIEYNKIINEDDRITTMTVAEFNQNPRKFDVLLSVSSIEHDGLGRYGDPINPTADFEFMLKAKELLREGGCMILSVPVGRDWLIWNACRVYGLYRLPLLLKGWNIVDTFGFSEIEYLGRPGNYAYQPVFILNIKN